MHGGRYVVDPLAFVEHTDTKRLDPNGLIASFRSCIDSHEVSVLGLAKSCLYFLLGMGVPVFQFLSEGSCFSSKALCVCVPRATTVHIILIPILQSHGDQASTIAVLK